MGPTVNPLRHMYLNGYSKAMARSSKQLEPLDEAIVDILNQIVSR